MSTPVYVCWDKHYVLNRCMELRVHLSKVWHGFSNQHVKDRCLAMIILSDATDSLMQPETEANAYHQLLRAKKMIEAMLPPQVVADIQKDYRDGN